VAAAAAVCHGAAPHDACSSDSFLCLSLCQPAADLPPGLLPLGSLLTLQGCGRCMPLPAEQHTLLPPPPPPVGSRSLQLHLQDQLLMSLQQAANVQWVASTSSAEHTTCPNILPACMEYAGTSRRESDTPTLCLLLTQGLQPHCRAGCSNHT
jgi:hypothetical protein